MTELLESHALVWGAGAKGVSLLNQLGVTHRAMPEIIDINPQKHGRFVPVAAQQVIAPEEIVHRLGRDSLRVLVMNPAYTQEVAAACRTLGLSVELETLDRSSRIAVHS